MSNKLQGSLTAVLGQLYSSVSSYTERPDLKDGSKRKLAAATAASVFGASLEKFNNTNLSDLTTDEEDESWLEDEDAASFNEFLRQKKLYKQQNHFIDVLLEKLLIHALPASIPDKSTLHDRINDPIRTATEPLSITKFSSNIRKLLAKLGGVFQAQYFILRIFHWTQPPLTLTALMVYTLIVLHPNILFILPLIYFMYGVMVPGYLYRHPISTLKLLDVKGRGDSLLNKFTRIKDDHDFDALLELDREVEMDHVPEVEDSTDSSSKLLKQNMEFFINMRDMQNSMTKMLEMSQNFENFWYGTGGFKNERISTSFFFNMFFSSVFLIVSGPYFPWRYLLIISGWLFLASLHPKIGPKLKELNELFKPRKKEIDKMVKESERKDIIIDEPPEVRQVEVFEIWNRSITTSQWEFYIYSPKIFDQDDYYRKSQKPPPGVYTIDDVRPPKSWRFDEDESWNIDYQCSEWVRNRLANNNKQNYIDDNDEFYVDHGFKRRRLYRNVTRYSKPARKPPNLL